MEASDDSLSHGTLLFFTCRLPATDQELKQDDRSFHRRSPNNWWTVKA
jgi:hypothetical protein